jgi:hypothetical protein
MPWNYQSINNQFYLQAKACQKSLSLEGAVCKNGEVLTSSTLYTRIMTRIRLGAPKNIPLMYHVQYNFMLLILRLVLWQNFS